MNQKSTDIVKCLASTFGLFTFVLMTTGCGGGGADSPDKVAQQIASKGSIALRFAKEAVIKSYELSLSEGLEYERKLFYTLFATEDQKEGMKAFLEKRKPDLKGR